MRKIDKFYENTQNAKPHKNVIEFLNIQKKSSNAIDLGCGTGRDTILLIENNWKVLAIDRENVEQRILSKLDENQITNLEFLQQEFEQLILKKNDLIVANYSLPFCNENDFYKLWHKIVDSINPGRIFCRKLLW